MAQPKKTPTKRSASPIQLEEFRAMSRRQEEALREYDSGQNLLLTGCAGTGKTMLSLYLGLTDVEERVYDRIVIVRSIVPTRDPGFLPGTLREKTAVYEAPYTAICTELYGRSDAYSLIKERGKVEFLTTSFVRGTTIRDSVIIVDEVQNMRWSEIASVLTRVGENCRVICAGDHVQTDLVKDEERRGIHDLTRVAQAMDSFSVVNFTSEDVLRSGFVKEFLTTKEALRIPD